MPTAADLRREAEQEAEAAQVLPADAVVDLAELRASTGTDEVLASLDRELVGLASVKERVSELAALLLVDRAREKFGITAPRPNLHMSFTGSPGTGKTTVALRMAELLHRLGYLRKGHLVTASRDDLVGQYVGHTAPKTKEVVKRAMGGMLFIDEAYYLYKADNERDYGQESIEILLQVMENHRDDLVVVLAGYADRMDVFFRANPGMSSRIAHHITFPDYTVDELASIADLMTREIGYGFSDGAGEVFRAYLERRISQPWFANARSVRNALERARLRHARRLLDGAGGAVGREALTTFERADFAGSRVFAGGAAAVARDTAAAGAPAADDR
ncbi:CbbX protein [Pseudonocardia sp.]|uniref:CbbX protein n=1 Tax=Pseudonocardia sp. TaxID=60912 RepID=UPI00262CAB1F|nr:CbbX protein [Pseudonocardia sp.]